MKKIYLFSAFVLASLGIQAQDSYQNDRMVNTSNSLHGTARYVGMGGAMSALGADVSTMSWNPAGIGVMRRSEFTITAGAGWDQKPASNVNKTHGVFDQFGAVYSLPLKEKGLKYVNFGFNMQKKIDFNNSFTAQGTLNGLSQRDQLCTVLNRWIPTFPEIVETASLPAMAGNFFAEDGSYAFLDYNDTRKYYNEYSGEEYCHRQHTWGGLNSFDFNISGNVDDRLFWGFTFGFDQMRYRMSNQYDENGSRPVAGFAEPEYGDYSVYNDQAVNGYGINAKLGIIVRPIEDNPFRFSFVLETPTKYSLRTNTSFQIEDASHDCYTNIDYTDDYYGHPFRYSLTSPMKLRMGLASTVSNYLAFDVDYEFANTHNTRMGYFRDDYRADQASLFQSDADNEMNELTKRNFKNTHTLRAGIEGKLTDQFALRAGFNFISSPNKGNVSFTQQIASDALNNSTGTYFMRMKPTYMLTLGMGYHWKHVSLDLAYKCSSQKADFHPFDDGDALRQVDYQNSSLPLSDCRIVDATAPSNVSLVRHQITATFGVRF